MGCTFSGLNALYDAVNGGGDVWINENRFRVVRQLGEGGFAYVYLVKEVRPDGSASGGGVASKVKDPSHVSGMFLSSRCFLASNAWMLKIIGQMLKILFFQSRDLVNDAEI